MSSYDNIISSLLTGNKVKMPLHVKDSSLRSCYRRTQQQAAQFGQILNKKLKISVCADTEQGYKIAELVEEESIPFTIITEEVKSDEESTD